jgi:cell division protein FtsN
MKHTMVTFRLHKLGLLLVIAGAVLLGVLLFAAGYLSASVKAAALPKVPAPAVPPLPLQKAGVAPVPDTAAPSAPAAAPATPPSAAAPPAETFALRVGAFADEQAAKESVKALADRGFAATIVAVAAGGATVLYTVRVGSYPTRAAAAAMADKLSHEHGIDAAVIPSR